MNRQDLITADLVRQLIDYDPVTGIVLWKSRPLSMFKTTRSYNGWNTRFVGKPVGFPRKKYVSTKIFNMGVLVHYLVWIYMTGEPPKEEINFKNRDTQDLRWENLREATFADNRRNSLMYKNNTSGYKGVSWNRKQKLWQASITVKYKMLHLGYFTSPEKAYEAYKAAALKYHGEFARI